MPVAWFRTAMFGRIMAVHRTEYRSRIIAVFLIAQGLTIRASTLATTHQG